MLSAVTLAVALAQVVQRTNILFIAIDDMNDWTGIRRHRSRIWTSWLFRSCPEALRGFS
jgi:hypothetical protein